MSAIYFDTDDDAAELLKALDAEGYTTDLRREGFAGEDDSDDRAWVVIVQPFDERVVQMVDVYGGWMPQDPRLDAEPSAPADPPRLPDAPHTLKKRTP